MTRKGRRLRRLDQALAQARPDLDDPIQLILTRRVLVDGRIADNPASLVRPAAAIAIVRETVLRGEPKLAAAVERFGASVDGRVALDLGAAAGGFTRVLLQAGAAKVYAVDAGFGQLLGSLRQDVRVVNLERTNVSALDQRLVPDEVNVVTADLSYLPLGRAVAQLNGRVRIAADAELLALVKPQFELGRSRPPIAATELAAAVDAAVAGVRAARWTVRGTTASPVRGSRGAIEFLLHAVRNGT
jgi:23S rRNA (cytidine1920-2'-O)/16S rRNA (cytidine1409-2'-O)-methyltransferase